MKMEKPKDRIETPYPPPAPNKLLKIKIKLIKAKIIMWPAVIFANKRSVRTIGLETKPINSITNINGIGNFNHHGTPGVL